MAKLVINPTSPARREIALSHASILTIGRDPSNDLVLPDAMVSRRHAVIEGRGSHYILRDCASANGSVVNGDRVNEVGLHDGDLLAIGTARLLFRDDPPDSASGKIVLHPSAQPLRCPSCGGEYRRGDLFCRGCGAQVAQPSGPPRAVCPSCGTAVPLPARFCSRCGTTLGEAEAGAAEAVRPETQPVAVPPEDASAPMASGSMAIAPQVRRLPPSPSRELSARRAPQAAADAPRPSGSAGSRLLAALVDGVFVLSGQVLLLGPVAWYWWARDAPRTPADVSFLPVLVSVALALVAVLLGALYHVYFWGFRGATPGKELLDLRVETEAGASPIGFGRAALRLFGYLLGLASLGVGFAMALSRGGALHDRIAGTRVARGRR